MQPESLFLLPSKTPVCIGTGFVVLDLLVNGAPNTLYKASAGGSCGNVLTILSYLGWRCYPFIRIGMDEVSRFLLSDLESWSVDTTLIKKDETISTPVVIERVLQGAKAIKTHQFELHCPTCKNRLPKYSALTLDQVKSYSEDLPKSNVFYFDRVRHANIELAKKLRKQGTIIFFEPSRINESDLFRQCIEVADIVKYSDEKAPSIPDSVISQSNLLLEIRTSGSHGLSYRRFQNTSPTEWMDLPAYSLEKVEDTAGAGDWCTAGIIHVLGLQGKREVETADRVTLERALNFGQLMAGMNSCYQGPRGIMYSLSKETFRETAIAALARKSQILTKSEINDAPSPTMHILYRCPKCPV